MRPLALILLATLVLSAEEPSRSIAVQGRVREVVAADRFVVQAGIRVVSPALEPTRQEAEAVLERLVQALVKAGLPRPVVESRQLGRHTRRSGGEEVADGFFVSIGLLLTLDKREHLDTALPILVQSEAVAVNGVAYRVQREIELRKELRRRALVAAREKAADMAGTLGAAMALG